MEVVSKPNIVNLTKPNVYEEYRGKGDDGNRIIERNSQ